MNLNYSSGKENFLENGQCLVGVNLVFEKTLRIGVSFQCTSLFKFAFSIRRMDWRDESGQDVLLSLLVSDTSINACFRGIEKLKCSFTMSAVPWVKEQLLKNKLWRNMN